MTDPSQLLDSCAAHDAESTVRSDGHDLDRGLVDPSPWIESWFPNPSSKLLQLTPRLGVAVLLFVLSLAYIVLNLVAGTLFPLESPPDHPRKAYYLVNLSWVIPSLLIFPVVYACIASFYQGMPETLREIDEDELLDVELEQRVRDYRKKWRWVGWVTWILLPLTLGLYLHSLVGEATWVWRGMVPPEIAESAGFLETWRAILTQLSPAGWLTTALHFIHFAAVPFFAHATLCLWRVVKEMKTQALELPKFHEDGAQGLAKLYRRASEVLIAYWLLSVYALFYAIDIVYIQETAEESALFLILMIGLFAGIPIVLYAVFLYPIHMSLLRTRKAAIVPLRTILNKAHKSIEHSAPGRSRDRLEVLNDASEALAHVRASIPQWPMGFNSPVGLVAVIVLQALPSIAALCVQFNGLVQ